MVDVLNPLYVLTSHMLFTQAIPHVILQIELEKYGNEYRSRIIIFILHIHNPMFIFPSQYVTYL
jgi:hypothetical protein